MTIQFDDNLDNVQAWKPIPEGQYEVVVSEVEETESKAGDPMVKITLTLANNESHNGAKVFYYMLFKGDQLGYTKRALIALGVDTKGMKKLDTEFLVGRKAFANIVHTTEDEMTFSNVQYLIHPDKAIERDEDGALKL